MPRLVAYVALVEGRRSRGARGREHGGVPRRVLRHVVRCIGRHHDEEGLIVLLLRFLQVFEGAGCQIVGLILVRRRLEVAAVLVEREVRIGLRLGKGEPVVPTRRCYGPARAVSVGVLPKIRGAIPGPFQPDRERIAFHAAVAVSTVAAERRLIAPDAMAVGVAARQDGCARRPAQRRGRDRVVKLHAARRNQGLHERHVAGTHRFLIVGHDDQNV